MSVAEPSPFLSYKEAVDLDNETRPKFLKLNVFWIKLSDFMDIVPRHSHLTGISLPIRAIVLHDQPFGKSSISTLPQEHGGEGGSPFVNGNLTNGENSEWR